jgi:peptide deformylase
MSILPILTVPNPALRQVSREVKTLDNKLTQILTDLNETLVKKSDPPGVGLSAIQTGIPLRILLLYLPPDPNLLEAPKNEKNFKLTVMINPIITAHSKSVTLGPNSKKPILEGCLSVPNLYAPVFRWDWIDISYETIDNSLPTVNRPPSTEKHQERFSGFPARVIQHEYDHLDGILFSDHVIGHSPMPGFKPLGPSQKLFFDDGDQLVAIPNPHKLITW